MRSGALRHSVIIQQPGIGTVNAFGGPTESWTQYAERRMGIKPLMGKELEAANERYGEVSHEFRARYLDGVTHDMRLLFPRTNTVLSSAIGTTDDVTPGVVSGSVFPRQGAYRIRVDDEVMEVTAGFATTAWTVTRAMDGTTAAAHVVAANVYLLVVADLVAPPLNVKERKHEMLVYATERA